MNVFNQYQTYRKEIERRVQAERRDVTKANLKPLIERRKADRREQTQS